MLGFARIALALTGVVCLAFAAILDAEFLRRNVAADGAITPGQAAALPAARLALAGFGVLLLAIAACLAPILASSRLNRFLSSRRRVEWTIFLAPIVALAVLAGYKLVRGPGDPFYLLAVREDSILEWLTALAFFGGFVVSCMVLRRMHAARRHLLSAYHALLAALCLFVGLEEISYGQRLFGFGTPDIVAARNLQNELTIHNLDMMLALFFIIGPLALGAFGLLGVLLAGLRQSIDPSLGAALSFIVPPWFLASWFVPIALFAAYDALAWQQTPLVEWQDQEPIEALVGVGFFAFLSYNLARLRHGHPLAEAPARQS